MITKKLAVLFLVFSAWSGAFAQTNETDIDALYDALRLTDVIQIMRDEGVSYGDELAEDLFPGRGTEEWGKLINLIYDVPTMSGQIKTAFHTHLAGSDVGPSLDFFRSEQGKKIVELEIAARIAMMDESVEEASKEQAAIASIDETPRYLLVQNFVEANDLIEANIVGALNSNYAFMTGLLDGGALPGEFSEDDILTDVWMQEPAIRSSTSEWAYSFLLLAFQPLEDADIEAYTAFSESEAGQQLTNALFASFDEMLERISRDLGLAASRFMTEQEL